MFFDIRELDENFIMYYKELRYIEWKIHHFLVSLFAIPLSLYPLLSEQIYQKVHIATVHTLYPQQQN